MLNIDQLLALFLDKFKFSPRVYTALAIIGAALALVAMNPDWLPFDLSERAAKFIGTLSVALLALSGSHTTKYLPPAPTVADEMADSRFNALLPSAN